SPAQYRSANPAQGAAVEHITWKQEAPSIIKLSQTIVFAARPGNGSETPVVSAYQMKEGDRNRSGKRWFNESGCSGFERLRSDPQVIESEIEQKSQAHEIKFAHVFVFILVNRLEPAVVTIGEIR